MQYDCYIRTECMHFAVAAEQGILESQQALVCDVYVCMCKIQRCNVYVYKTSGSNPLNCELHKIKTQTLRMNDTHICNPDFFLCSSHFSIF